MGNGANVLGPVGGPGGSYEEYLFPGPWWKAGAVVQDDCGELPTDIAYLEGGLTEIMVIGGDWINGVSFNDSLGNWASAGDMTAGTLGTLSLNPTDIDKIVVNYGDYVNGLTFKMMDGTQHVIAGSESAPNWDTIAIGGMRIVGLACRSGSYLDAFGVICAPPPASE